MPKVRKLKQPRINQAVNFLKETNNRLEEIEGYFDDPSGGLVPIGDTGLYITPDEPADPRDCDRYPDSIYCSNEFYTETPIALEPKIAIDECNIGIRLDGSIGFIRVPPISLVYRKKECRKQEFKGKEFVPPNGTYSIYPPVPSHNCTTRDDNIVLSYPNYVQYYQERQFEYTALTTETFEYSIEVVNLEFPYQGDYILKLTNQQLNTIYNDARHYKYILSNGYVKPIASIEFNVPVANLLEFEAEGFSNSYIPPESYYRNILYVYPNGITSFNFLTKDFSKEYGSLSVIPGSVYANLDNRGITAISETPNTRRISSTGDIANKNKGWYYREERIDWIYRIICYGDGISPKEECCMACCPPQDDTLSKLVLREIAKLSLKVNRLSEVIGIDEYPASLPASLISKDEGFLGNLIPNSNKEIPNLTQFLAWYVERFDEVLGQWEIPIEIKDSDPSKPGDQPLGVKLPNMAEAIAEIFTLAFQTNLNSETLLNFAVRTAAETVTDKQQNFITYKLMQSMAEWAGYKQKDIKLKMPILFSLGKKRYDEILNESEIDVPCVDFDEKFGLEADLMRFREAVAILQANYKRKVDPSGDVKGQILKHLLDAFAAVNKVSGESDDEDFDKFLTDVENGFINTPGATNTTEPYGRPYNQRPKIRDLTKNDPPTTP